MQTLRPSNSGVYLEASVPAPDDSDRPRVGYVIAVGGGVPWLRPRMAVFYNPRRAQHFTEHAALVDQQDVLGVVDGVLRATCPNGCHETPGSGCTSCPLDKEDHVHLRRTVER